MSQALIASAGSAWRIERSSPVSSRALRGETALDRLAQRGHPLLRLPVRLAVRHPRHEPRERVAGVADDPDRGGVGRADPGLVGVGVDERGRSQAPVARRLGSELGADREQHVRALQERRERAVVAGRAGGERVVLG